MNDRGPIRKSYGAHRWALTNWGIVWCVERTRKECIESAERITGEPWRECSKNLELRKVTLVSRASDLGSEIARQLSEGTLLDTHELSDACHKFTVRGLNI